MSELFYTLFKMSLQGIVIILIVGLVRLILKKLSIGHKYIVGLWLIVFFYLVFPWKLSLPIGFWENGNIPEVNLNVTEGQISTDELFGNNSDLIVDNMVTNINHGFVQQETAPKQDYITNGDKSEVAASNIMNEDKTDAATSKITDNKQGTTDIPVQTLRLWSVPPVIWLVGLIGFILYFIYSYIAIKKKLSMSIPYKENMMWVENMNTPMVFGIWNPKIYLPISVERENLPYIIAHEKMHIKRKDTLLKMTAYLITIIHWFNPFVWGAYFLLGSDIEKACDEEVISRIGAERRKEYAYSLLRIASGEASKKRRIFVAPICFDEGNVKGRIKNVAKYRYTLPGIGAIVVMLGIVLAGLFLTQTESEATQPDSANDPVISEQEDNTEALSNEGNKEASNEEVNEEAEENGEVEVGGDLTVENQFKIIAENLEYLKENVNPGEVNQFAVTDLDHNGRLELIVSSCGGTGIYTYSNFYEINETYDSLEECPTDFVEGDSQADMSNVVIVYQDEELGVYYHVFFDLTKNGAAEYYENKRAITLKDGQITQKYLAYKTTIYIDSNPNITYADANNNMISEAEYDMIEDNVFSGMRKFMYNIEWRDFQELDGLDQETEVRLLMESYDGFVGDEIYPSMVLTDESTAYLEYLCPIIPEFASAEDMDAEFWKSFVFNLCTRDFERERVERTLFTEALGNITSVFVKVSLEEVDALTGEIFGVKLTDNISPVDIAGDGGLQYEDGYFYVEMSDPPVYTVTLQYEDKYNGITRVEFSMKHVDSDWEGKASLYLIPTENENGFIVSGKEMETVE